MLELALAVVVSACPPRTFCNTTGPVATDALFGALVLARDDAWAFGWKAALHWDGSSWSTTKLPEFDRLQSAVALAPNDIWVSGNNLVLHWDGTEWRSISRGRNDGFAGPLVEVSPGEVWALGTSPLRVENGALSPLPAAAAKALSDPKSLALDATVCGPNELWIARRNAAQNLVLTHWDGVRSSRIEREERADVASMGCVDHEVWVTLENETLRCKGERCELVAAPVGGRLVKGTTGPWLVAKDGLYRWNGTGFQKQADAPGKWYGGAARANDDVLLVGAVGSTARWDGKRLTLPARVSLGRVSDLSVSREGEPWVAAEKGLFVFRGGAWSQLRGFPANPNQGQLWVDSTRHAWVLANGRAWRWGGAKWQDLTPSGRSTYVVDVWGRSETEVWFTTPEAVLAWDGKKFRTVATAPREWSFGQLAGDATHLAVMMRGPRPEATDGPSTGMADRVLVLDGATQRTLDLPGRPTQLAWVTGQLWATGSGVSRLSGDQWETVDDISRDVLVPTATGALLWGNNLAWEWDGTTLKRVDFPAGRFVVGAAAGTTVWVAGHDAVLRRESP